MFLTYKDQELHTSRSFRLPKSETYYMLTTYYESPQYKYLHPKVLVHFSPFINHPRWRQFSCLPPSMGWHLSPQQQNLKSFGLSRIFSCGCPMSRDKNKDCSSCYTTTCEPLPDVHVFFGLCLLQTRRKRGFRTETFGHRRLCSSPPRFPYRGTVDTYLKQEWATVIPNSRRCLV